MTLSAGARLGAYEILAPLGASGMGKVYRARESTLGRDDLALSRQRIEVTVGGNEYEEANER